MTDSQSNSLDMFLAVNKFYLANQALIDAVMARKQAFTQLQTNIAAINVNIGGQSATTKGVTKDKSVLRQSLETIAYVTLSPARAWAVSVNNLTLAEQFHVTESQLMLMKDDTIGAFCEMRLQLVQDNLTAMVDHGITQALLDTWSHAITDYDDRLAEPRQAIITRKQKTANLKQLFKQTAQLFTNIIDPLMVPLKLSAPEEYGLYLGARVIIDRGGHVTGDSGPKTPSTDVTIDGLSVNAENDMPLESVTIKATYPPGTETRQATSDVKGIFKVVIKGLPTEQEIPVQVLATHTDFQDTHLTVNVEAGRSYLLTVPMVPLVPPPPPATEP